MDEKRGCFHSDYKAHWGTSNETSAEKKTGKTPNANWLEALKWLVGQKPPLKETVKGE